MHRKKQEPFRATLKVETYSTSNQVVLVEEKVQKNITSLSKIKKTKIKKALKKDIDRHVFRFYVTHSSEIIDHSII